MVYFSDVTRIFRLFRCPDDKIRHPGHYGRFSSDFYVMAFRTDTFMNLSVKRKTESFFGAADKEARVSEVMSVYIVAFAAVLRILMQKFHARHLRGFFRYFYAVSYEKGVSVEFNERIAADSCPCPPAHKFLRVPRGSPKKARHRVITCRIQHKPPDNAAYSVMVESDYETENNNRKPGKSSLAGKAATEFRDDRFNNINHNNDSFYN
ncbi:hypothetical protein [Desulfonema magnum]|uniref:hypothetical protein n=1 Tax=Desulfonema magnum TaxID=45655 RepID=UPI001CA5DD01|nr:hypothetical protein [Desulfonema magnum]